MNRRDLLKLGTAAGMSELAALAMHGCGGGSSSTPTTPSPGLSCSQLTDIEHVIIFIQENRSFDHYFGNYRGVRGFSDQSAALQQPDPANTTNAPVGFLLPFHLDTATTNAACTHDITHDWVPQHQSWDNGAMSPEGNIQEFSGLGVLASCCWFLVGLRFFDLSSRLNV